MNLLIVIGGTPFIMGTMCHIYIIFAAIVYKILSRPLYFIIFWDSTSSNDLPPGSVFIALFVFALYWNLNGLSPFPYLLWYNYIIMIKLCKCKVLNVLIWYIYREKPLSHLKIDPGVSTCKACTMPLSHTLILKSLLISIWSFTWHFPLVKLLKAYVDMFKNLIIILQKQKAYEWCK